MARDKSEDEARKKLRNTDKSKGKAARDKKGVKKYYEKEDEKRKKENEK